MARPRRTPMAAMVSLATVGLLLAGCSASGRIDVLDDARVSIDVLVAHAPDGPRTDANGVTTWDVGGPCTRQGLPPGLAVEQLGTAAAPRCRLRGVVRFDESPVWVDAHLVRQGGYVFARIPRSAGAPDASEPSGLTLSFPGDVLLADRAEIRGREVLLTIDGSGSPTVATIVAGTTATADPTRAWAVGAAVLGLGLGAGVAAGGRRARARWRAHRPDLRGSDATPFSPVTPASPASPAERRVAGTQEPEDPGVWAPRPEDLP